VFVSERGKGGHCVKEIESRIREIERCKRERKKRKRARQTEIMCEKETKGRKRKNVGMNEEQTLVCSLTPTVLSYGPQRWTSC